VTSEQDRAALLRLARHAIASHIGRSATPTGPAADEAVDALSRRAGAFVTLHQRGELRGCIGHVEPDAPLAATVARCAVAAATEDPRFPSVSPAEIGELEIEISVLGALEPVTRLDEIEIGRHGLVVESDWHRGLLLPQVASERGWNVDTFVEQTCRKAGLAADAWKSGARIWKFEAEVFGEGATPNVNTDA
jgi:AmmeMemoRadiSam system protein A